MGQFILFLLGLFAIGCVFYGISAGVQMIQRGFSYVVESAIDDASDKRPLVDSLPPGMNSTPTAKASSMQHGIDELRTLFALYQQGALTQAEFEGMKRSLLVASKNIAPQGQ